MIMIEPDTIRLLRECDAGIKMATSSIDDVVDYVHDSALQQTLLASKEDHAKLQREVQSLLADFHDEGKDPNPMAKSMSWLKTNMKLIMHESDKTIADLMTDGCNMGIKSLNKYLNQYEAADEHSKNITKQLVRLEEQLIEDVRGYL